MTFLEAFIRHLPRLHSDHNPLLISLESNMVPSLQHRPFQFQAMWLLNDQFQPWVESFWTSSTDPLPDKLQELQLHLKNNAVVFANIFQRKRCLFNRLADFYRALTIRFNPFLHNLEHSLRHEYIKILDQEELLWKQKSRNSRFKDGDRNTEFFHMSTITRRRRNRIEGRWNNRGSGLRSGRV